MSVRLALLLAALAAGPVQAQTAPPPAGTAAVDDLARRVQAHYDTVRDFEADFTQTYEGGVLRQKATEKGTVAVRRPGRMRWTYTAPEKKEFVSDGVKVYSYVPADKQVIVSPMPAPGDTTPALFLSGQGNLVRDFTASAIDLPGAAPGLIGIKLTPKRDDRDFAWLAIGVDPATLQIRHLVASDRQGGTSTFAFTNLRENRALSDKLFEFKIPKGVDVVTNEPR
jgi:outer membrane lipoprotein carrier protein